MKTNAEENKEYLEKNVGFWNALKDYEKQLLIDSIKLSEIPKGTQLVRSSSECRGMIMLKKGRIRAFISSEDGREVTLYRLVDGDTCIMSASCMLKSVRFQVFLEVEKDASMFIIPQTVFIRLNSENNAVKDYTMNLLADKFSQSITIIDNMVFGSIPSRIASFLIEMIGLEGKDDLDITHDSIAKNIGTAREVVSRILKKWENEDIVQLTRGKVIVLNSRRLYDITN